MFDTGIFYRNLNLITFSSLKVDDQTSVKYNSEENSNNRFDVYDCTSLRGEFRLFEIKLETYD